MKKLLNIFAVLFAFSLLSCTPAPALATDFSAGVGADTNFVFRGQSLSQRGVSANAGAKLGVAGLYVADTAHTVSFANSNINLLNVAEAGYETNLGPVAVAGGYTYYAFTGGATKGVPASDTNFGEGFAQASLYGLTAKYAKVITAPVGTTGKNEYARLSYSSPKFSGFGVTAGIEQVKYKTANVNDTNCDLTVGYDVSKNLTTFVSYVHAGNGVNGIKMANQVDVGAKYGF